MKAVHQIFLLACLAALGQPLLAGPEAHAGFIVQALPATANQGDNGSFEVTLTNNFGSAMPLSGFSLQLTADSGITFTGVDIFTSAPYVFDLSGAGLLPVESLPSSTLTISDLMADPPGYVSLAAGETFGLARVSFHVDAGASAGAHVVTFTDLGFSTALYDDNLAAYGVGANGASFSDITVQVNGSGSPLAAPAPASLTLLALGMLCLGGYALRRRTVLRPLRVDG